MVTISSRNVFVCFFLSFPFFHKSKASKTPRLSPPPFSFDNPSRASAVERNAPPMRASSPLRTPSIPVTRGAPARPHAHMYIRRGAHDTTETGTEMCLMKDSMHHQPGMLSVFPSLPYKKPNCFSCFLQSCPTVVCCPAGPRTGNGRPGVTAGTPHGNPSIAAFAVDSLVSPLGLLNKKMSSPVCLPGQSLCAFLLASAFS